MDTIELIEGTDLAIPADRMTGHVARALAADPRFDLEFPTSETGGHYRLRSLGWAGQFSVEDSLIVATPRQPIAAVLAMLDVAYGLERFRVSEDAGGTAAIGDLFQRAVGILADEAQERIQRGLYRRHVERVEDLCLGPSPTGRPGILARLFQQDSYLRCRYDEHTAILQDNQILLWALHAASKARLSGADVDRKIRRGCRALAGSLDLTRANANHGIDRFYGQLDAGQRPLQGLCRLILEHTGPALPSGGQEFVPFAINMPALFRAFIARWLKASLPKQYRLRERCTGRLRTNGLFAFHGGIVIEDRTSARPLMVLDTEYQHDAEPSDQNLQRTTAADLGAVAAILVYPSAPPENVPTPSGGIALRAASFDLHRPLAEAGEDFLKQILRPD